VAAVREAEAEEHRDDRHESVHMCRFARGLALSCWCGIVEYVSMVWSIALI
jgi:hypothetical protein